MTVTVRPHDPDAPDAFLTLYRACLAHYDEGPADRETVEALILRELAAPFGTFAHIAWAGDLPVGFTCWMRVFPAGNGFALYLKELFVTEAARGTGAGRALMQQLARTALDQGCDTLRWETGETGARAFYGRLGAEDDGKTHYTLDGPALARLSE
ncbi:N-acetyltransferase [Jannaschia pagri]|uniref:N-acetyltransferase n=1 Tax=Jannaschia pagri TaxID=2829797 RepID=A0ABQ4NLB8_9RHOB|nr:MULTISPECIES: GNAT family N-acetyltransferase [unclassified Jannaschia]GIT91346.1 N-acetyltransferase [Jannaschia sp. AI_61]GIT95179.1 N-acetyltransferase [Jannaschia sp. AI_62]